MSDDSNIKYVNFKYIILAPPDILVKIRHCYVVFWSKKLDVLFCSILDKKLDVLFLCSTWLWLIWKVTLS